MIKVEVEGCIMPLKGGERGAYKRAYSRSLFYDVRRHNNRRNMFAYNESPRLLSTTF